jgi:hypothetical protein
VALSAQAGLLDSGPADTRRQASNLARPGKIRRQSSTNKNGHAVIADLLPTLASQEEIIAEIIPELFDEADIDWSRPLGQWSKEEMIRFLSLARDLMQ